VKDVMALVVYWIEEIMPRVNMARDAENTLDIDFNLERSRRHV